MIRNRLAVALIAMTAVLVVGCGKNAPDPSAVPAAGSSQSSGSSATTNSGSTAKGSGETTGSNTNTNTNTSSNATGGSNTQTTKPATTEKVSLGPLKVGEIAKVHLVHVTMDEVGVITKTAGLPPGYAYLMIKFTVKNEMGGPFSINVTDHFKLMQPDGKSGRYNLSATAQREPRLGGTLTPGSAQTGWAGYLIKLVEGNYKFTFTHPDFGQAVWEFKP